MTDNQTLAFRRAHTVWASELAALSRWSPVVNGKTMNVSCDLPLAPQPQFRRHFGEDSTDMWYICADAWGVSEPSRPRLPPLGPSLHGLSHERDVIECELLQQPSDSNCALGESFRCELDSSVTTGARLANIVVQPGCKGRFRCGGAKVSCGHMEARAGRKAGLWQRMCRCVETRPLPFRTGKAGWPTSRQSEGCLAVSIGIGNEWGFEDGLADMGCTVHAFDPTPQLLLKHQRHTADPNNRGRIHFQPIGLGAEGYAPAKCGDDCRRTYGQVDRSATLPLDAILRNATAMHHTNIVDVLKIDCEGCEWQALLDVATRVPRLLSQVRILLLEVHATFHYGLKHHLWVDSLLNHLVGTHGFRVYRAQYNQGFQKSRFRVPTVLGKAGFRRRPCCWLLSLMRPDALVPEKWGARDLWRR